MKKIYLVYMTDGKEDWVIDAYTTREEALKYVTYWNEQKEYPEMYWITESVLREKSLFSKKD